MAKNVFIAPGSKEHINKSVVSLEQIEETGKLISLEGLIPIENIADTLTDMERQKLEEIYSDRKVRMWGTRPGSEGTWNHLNEGDYVVFYSNNRYICAAETAFKTENKKLAEKVWGRYKTGETWDFIFFVKNVRQLNIDRKEFNKKAGYKENFVPQGFVRVANDVARDKILNEIISEEQGDVIALSPKAEEFIRKWKSDPETQAWLERKNKAFEKWRVKFGAQNVDKLSRNEFKIFLGFNENQSWGGIQRQSSVYEDMTKLRRTIKYLTEGLNEATLEEISARISHSLDYDGDYKIKGLGRAVVTGITHICDTKNRIGVWNAKIEEALKKLDLPIPKGPGSNGSRYLQFNHILSLIGRKHNLNLRQVDMLMYQIAEKYQPTAVFTFTFVSKDFESCTGKKDDATYLSKRFKELLQVLKNALGDKFANYKSYSARPNLQPKRGQKRAEYRDHMWLGFAHHKFERAQKGIQFQVVINADDPFYVDIWIDRRAPLARKLAKENIEKNREAFEKSLQSLAGFEIGLYEGHKLEQQTTELTDETMKEFIDNIPTYNTHVHIGKTLTKSEVLSAGPKIIDTIVNTFDELYQTYSLLIGEPLIGIGKIRSIDEIISYVKSKGFYYPEETIKNYHTSLETKPFVILSGITGIGKTQLTELYANGFCGVDKGNRHYKKNSSSTQLERQKAVTRILQSNNGNIL